MRGVLDEVLAEEEAPPGGGKLLHQGHLNRPAAQNECEGQRRGYCTISIDSAVTRHRACGLGRIRSLVPRHKPYGRRLLVDPKNGQKRL